MTNIILASASPRRKALLKVLGLEFNILVSNAEEVINETDTVENAVKSLSLQKATEISKQADKNAIIIGADTVVAINGKILGKPTDKQNAVKMLKMLSGNTHSVYTGFTVIRNSDMKTITDYEKTDVTFRNLSDNEILEYVENNNVLDKAGSYSIQGTASSFVTKLDGDYNNVVGLPIYKLSKYLYNDFNI